MTMVEAFRWALLWRGIGKLPQVMATTAAGRQVDIGAQVAVALAGLVRPVGRCRSEEELWQAYKLGQQVYTSIRHQEGPDTADQVLRLHLSEVAGVIARWRLERAAVCN